MKTFGKVKDYDFEFFAYSSIKELKDKIKEYPDYEVIAFNSTNNSWDVVLRRRKKR